MSQTVIVLAGAKQSGKSTAAKYIHGLRMQQAGIIPSFRIDHEDDLLITLPTGQECVLDIHRQDAAFVEFAAFNVWPFAKVYSFAAELKNSVCSVFGVDPQCVYGSDADKNKPTHITWRNISHLLSASKLNEVKDRLDEFLTHRELLQEFGTICRVFDPDCWLRAEWNKIRAEGYPLAIIDDGRYENEIDYSNEQGAKTVRLTLQPFKNDTHSSELIHLVPREKFYREIDNAHLSINQKNSILSEILDQIAKQ